MVIARDTGSSYPDLLRDLEHPECKDGEILLCNMQQSAYEALNYKSKRLGKKAIHLKSGEEFEMFFQQFIFPVFVDRTEYNKKNPHNPR